MLTINSEIALRFTIHLAFALFILEKIKTSVTVSAYKLV